MKTFGQDEAGKDQQTARRWWRRLREEEDSGAAPVVGSTAGAIVREGERVRLRRHVAANRGAFQRWYADHDIARLLRHELRPLTYVQSLVYFDTSILPSSAHGLTCAIHDRETDELIGTTGLTDLTSGAVQSCYFRIVIGESRYWGRGYGTEATRLMMREAFERHGRDIVRLEVFDYNERAIRAYERVGFEKTGEHTEYPSRESDALRVIEMSLRKEQFDLDPDQTPA
jgi:RimJ/RimL family protein N-acetyltransferase